MKFSVFILFLVVFSSLVYAATTTTFGSEVQSIGSLFGKDVEADAFRVASASLTQADNSFKFSFNGEKGFLQTPKSKIENVAPALGDVKSLVEIKDNKVVTADLVASADAQIVIEGTTFIIPKGAHLEYHEGSTPKVTYPDNFEVKNSPSTVPVAIAGKNLKLSPEVILSDGQLLMDSQTEFEISPESNIILNNNCRITAGADKVHLITGSTTPKSLRNVVLGGCAKFGGNGFTVEVDPELLKDSTLREFGEGKTIKQQIIFPEGKDKIQIYDEGPYVTQIQEFLVKTGYLPETFVSKSNGLQKNSVDGFFGERTKKALEKWQADNIQRVLSTTGQCIGILKKESCVPDGVFGLNTASALQFPLGAPMITFSPKGGEVIVGNGETVTIQGASDVKISGKNYEFDGENLLKDIHPGRDISTLPFPLNLKFITKEGIATQVLVSNGDMFLNNMRSEVIGAELGKKITVQASCASTITHYVNFCAHNPHNPKFMSKADEVGVSGSAWQMQERIKAKGGRIVYDITQSYTAEEQAELATLREESKKNSAPASKDKSKEGIPSEPPINIEQSLLPLVSRDRFSSQIPIEKGDVISLYVSNSPYIKTALSQGRLNAVNSHVAIIHDIQEDSLVYENTITPDTVATRLLVDVKSLYVDKFELTTPTGVIPVALKDGKFLKPDGSEVTESGELKVYRPVTFEQRVPAFVSTPLDSRVFAGRTVTAVSRPVESDYLKDYASDSEVLVLGTPGCEKCTRTSIEKALQAKEIPEPEELIHIVKSSTELRTREYGLSPSQAQVLAPLSLAIMDRESGIGTGEWYTVERAIEDPSITQGYLGVEQLATLVRNREHKGGIGLAQMSEATLKTTLRPGEKLEDFDLYNRADAITAEQRYLARLIKSYSDGDQAPTAEDISFIAADISAGPLASKNAGLQQMLQQMDYFPQDLPTSGRLGENTKAALVKAAQDLDISIDEQELDRLVTNPEALHDSKLVKQIRNRCKSDIRCTEVKAAIPNSIKDPGLLRSLGKSSRGISAQDYANGVLRLYQEFGGQAV